MRLTGTRKRRFGLAVYLLALMLLAAACGGDGDTDGGQDGGQAEGGQAEGGTDGGTEGGDPAAFYEAETVTFVVPYDPGGGFDAYARGVAPYLEEELGGNVTVQNVPGAGGLLGANQAYTAEGDGTTIALINYPGAIFAELSGQEGAEFDNSQWNVLGRIAAVNPVIYTGTDSQYQSAEDMIQAEEPVVFGLGGVGSDSYYGTIAISETLGIPYELVTGYEGSGEADAAMIAGEVDASFNSLDSALALIESGDATPVMYVGTEPAEELPDTPTIVELAEGDDEQTMQALASIYDLERIIVTGPDVPEDRVDYLQEALLAAMENPEFQSDMEEAGRSLNILSGPEAEELIDNVGGSLDQLRPLVEGQ